MGASTYNFGVLRECAACGKSVPLSIARTVIRGYPVPLCDGCGTINAHNPGQITEAILGRIARREYAITWEVGTDKESEKEENGKV